LEYAKREIEVLVEGGCVCIIVRDTNTGKWQIKNKTYRTPLFTRPCEIDLILPCTRRKAAHFGAELKKALPSSRFFFCETHVVASLYPTQLLKEPVFRFFLQTKVLL